MVGKVNFSGEQYGYNDSASFGKVGAAGKPEEQGMSVAEARRKKQTGEIECATCDGRQYVDGSDDPGVSFKTPTKIAPEQAASKVMAHEMEHYNRETAKAEREDREVVSNSIAIYRSVCPECGKSYVSGGLTTTVTRKRQENDHFFQKFFDEKIAAHLGKEIDVKA